MTKEYLRQIKTTTKHKKKHNNDNHKDKKITTTNITDKQKDTIEKTMVN